MYNRKHPIQSLIIDFLRGEELSEIERDFNRFDLCKDKFKTCAVKAGTDSEHERLARIILLELGISARGEQNHYIDTCSNIYDLVTSLYRDGHRHLGTFIDLIPKKPKRTTSPWITPLLLSGFTLFITGLLEQYQHEYLMRLLETIKEYALKAFSWGQRAFSIARNVALVGLVFNTLKTLYGIYSVVKDDKRSNTEKVSDSSFTVIAGALTITSYLITIGLKGAMSALAGSFFVAATTVGIFKGAYDLYKSAKEAKKFPQLLDTDPPVEQAQCLRKQYLYNERRSALMIDIFKAVCATAVIAAWCFMPFSLGLVAACVGALAIIEATSAYINQTNKHRYATNLQARIKGIIGINEEKAEVKAEPSSSARIMSQLDNEGSAPVVQGRRRIIIPRDWLREDEPLRLEIVIESAREAQAFEPAGQLVPAARPVRADAVPNSPIAADDVRQSANEEDLFTAVAPVLSVTSSSLSLM